MEQQEEKYSSIFAAAVNEYVAAKLSIFPCGGDNGKKPVIHHWKKYQDSPPNSAQIKSWVKQHPNANIALVTGKVSGITVVDCDDMHDFTKTIEIFGSTPLQVRTAKGVHLYYKYSGEKSSTRVCGLSVDIRGDGGYVVAPPSTNPDNGHVYNFICGTLENITHLPTINPKALEEKHITSTPSLRDGEIISVGNRNLALFDELRIKARNCKNKEELSESAIFINNTMLEPPLERKEVNNIVKSVWSYKERGLLMFKGERYANILENELISLMSYPPAFCLFSYLKMHHYGLRDNFVISDLALSKPLGWSENRVTQARRYLLDNKFVTCIYQGGKKKGDASLYRFTY